MIEQDPIDADFIGSQLKDWEDSPEDWRQEAYEAYRFVAGDQWSQEDFDAMKAAKRPAFSLNLVTAFVRGICGLEVGNRQEARYLPREMGDVQANEVLPGGPPHEGGSMQVMLRSRRLRGVVSAFVIAGLISSAPAAARAADAKHVGVGVACAFGNLLYGPAKLIVAMLGTVTAGLGYAVTAGDVDVARKILDSSVMGNYVIEPDHITGGKKLEFIGNPNPPPADDWSAPPQNSGF